MPAPTTVPPHPQGVADTWGQDGSARQEGPRGTPASCRETRPAGTRVPPHPSPPEGERGGDAPTEGVRRRGVGDAASSSLLELPQSTCSLDSPSVCQRGHASSSRYVTQSHCHRPNIRIRHLRQRVQAQSMRGFWQCLQRRVPPPACVAVTSPALSVWLHVGAGVECVSEGGPSPPTWGADGSSVVVSCG